MTIENLGVKLYSGTKADRKSDSLGSSADGTNNGITLTGGKFTKTTTDAYDLTKMYEKSEIAVTSNPSASGYRNGMTMSADGTKMYIVGDESTPWANEAVYQWNLSTAWDITTAVFSQSKDIGTDVGIPQGISFSADGTKMFVGGSESNIIKRWSLTSAWDISTAGSVDSGQSLDVSSWAYVYGILINSDGTNLYVCTGYSAGSTQAILRKYTLSTAYDLTSASATQTTSGVSGVEWKALAFNNDGTKLFIVEKSPNDKVEEYSLDTAYDLTTMGSADSSISFGTTDPTGIFFGNSGKDMFVCEDTGDRVVEYSTTVVPAYSFDGSADRIEIGDPLLSGTGDFTFSVWVYPTSSSYEHIWTNYDNGSGTRYALIIDSYVPKWYTSGVATDSSGVTLSANTWSHITVSRNSGVIKFHINGVDSGTTFTRTNSYATNANAVIGSADDGSQAFTGKMDDIGFWKRALTTTEIADLVNAPNSWWVGGTSKNVAIDGNTVTTGSGSGWANWVQGKAVTSPTTLEFTVDDTSTNVFVGFGTGTGADSPSGGSPIKNCVYLTSGGDVFWSDSTGTDNDTGSNRASGDTYKLVWQSNGNLDLYLKPSGGSYGSSLKAWTSVTGTLYPMVQGYGGIVVTMLPTETADGALVSSLSDKSNLKAYYSMDTVTTINGSPIMNILAYSGATNFIHVGDSYKTRGEKINASDSALVGYKVSSVTVTIKDYDGNGLTGNLTCTILDSSGNAVSGDSFAPYNTAGLTSTESDVTFTNSNPTRVLQDDDSIALYYNGDATHKVGFKRSDGGDAFDGTKTCRAYRTGTSGALGVEDTEDQIMKIVPSVDGCVNDFSSTSALDGVTGVRTNSIFIQTDDVPKYFWYQSDGTWEISGIPTPDGWWDMSASDTTTSSVTDKSGNGHTLVQSTSSKRPSVTSSAQNGLNALTFVKDDDFMITTDNMTCTPQQTVFCVFKVTKETANGWQYYLTDGGTSHNAISQNGDNWRLSANGNTDTSNSSWDRWLVLTVQFNGSSSFLRDNGSQTAVNSTLESGNGTGFTLNGYAGKAGTSDSGRYGATSSWGECIVYNSILNSAQIKTVEAYLKEKWGTP